MVPCRTWIGRESPSDRMYNDVMVTSSLLLRGTVRDCSPEGGLLQFFFGGSRGDVVLTAGVAVAAGVVGLPAVTGAVERRKARGRFIVRFGVLSRDGQMGVLVPPGRGRHRDIVEQMLAEVDAPAGVEPRIDGEVATGLPNLVPVTRQ